MKIYTRAGDRGETTFFANEKIKKNHPYIELIGTLDELNSVIGVTLCFLENKKIKESLVKVQNNLFILGADLTGNRSEGKSCPKITEEHVQEVEGIIDRLEEKLGIPKNFILPNGTKSSSFLHLCRTVTRRAERILVGLQDEINPMILSYINRLSDLFYVFARYENNEVKVNEQQPIYMFLKDKWKGMVREEEE